MKTLLISLILLCSLMAYTQPETLEGEIQVVQGEPNAEEVTVSTETSTASSARKQPGFTFGGYLSMTQKISHVQGAGAWMTGGGVGFVFNKNFHLGFEGYAMLSAVESSYRDPQTGNPHYLEFAYGGARLEPVVWQYDKARVSIPMLIGAGGVGVHEYRYTNPDHWDWYDYGYQDWDLVFVAEPGINIDYELSRAVHLTAGVSYRWVEDATLQGTTAGDLSGFGGHMTLRLGWY